MARIAGFDHAEVEFDKGGKAVDPAAADRLISLVEGKSDLFVMSHGWNNDRRIASRLYEDFFGQLQSVLQSRGLSQAKMATAGVFWPSILFSEDEGAPRGGAASLAGRAEPQSGPGLTRELERIFQAPEQLAALAEMGTLLAERPKEPEALARFQEFMATLVESDATGEVPPEDAGQQALFDEPPERVFEAMASVGRRPRSSAVGVGDPFDRLWDGAREALRAASYFQMKNRAGVVGEKGLGPLLGRVNAVHPALRIHLIGHSFGARVVSFSLKGLPQALVSPASPIKSLFLIQGAFSHFAFADVLPHDRNRGGALKGMAGRVDGPLVVTHSTKDTAVGVLYPKASLLARADAAAVEGGPSRWGAMGSFGAQAVEAAADRLKPVGESYTFAKARFLNLDGNQLIVKGGPPSGAHSDIVHPEVAWAVLAAAGTT